MKIKNSHCLPRFVHLVISMIILVSIVLGGCSSPSAPEPAQAIESVSVQEEASTDAAPPTATPAHPTEAAPTEEPPTPTPEITLVDIAAEVAAEVGVVTEVIENDDQTVIFVFEERHDSILGQIEIAIMLNRLYRDYDMRHIGLEGHMADEGSLELSWAHREPYFQPDQNITGREDVMVQMTQEGEFSGVELIGLLYNDIFVDGIDDAELYAFDPPEEAWDAPDFYLYYIALAGMNDTENTAWQALYDAEQYSEAFEFALGTDDFAGEMYEKLNDPVDIVSAEAWLTALNEIQAQAEDVEVELSEEDIANLDGMGEYFEHVSQRSDAMVDAILALAEANPDSPLAMNIGALHTERVSKLLAQAGVSYAIIRPDSMEDGNAAGLLSVEAYQRKAQGLSVAPDGWLGSFLDGRKKPKPVAEKEWVKIQEVLREELQKMAEQAAMDNRSNIELEEEFYRRFVITLGGLIDSGLDLYDLSFKLQVLPGTEDNAHRQVVLTLDFPDGPPHNGKTLEITAQAISLSFDFEKKSEVDIKIEERLQQARKETVDDSAESLAEATQEDESKPQKICSNTEITKITKTGG
jgi:hypothetical protein